MNKRHRPTPSDLMEVLQKHRKWLESKRELGQRAALSKTDLSGCKLLRGADLRDALFEDTDLSGADLSHAVLSGVAFKEVKLRGTNLRDAILENADLSTTEGLVAAQVRGANLLKASLPKDVIFGALDTVKEASHTARPVFLGILAACIYSLLAVVSTTDSGLLTNSSTTALPLLAVDVPIAWFFAIVPGLLLAIYIYLHLYLQRLLESPEGLQHLSRVVAGLVHQTGQLNDEVIVTKGFSAVRRRSRRLCSLRSSF